MHFPAHAVGLLIYHNDFKSRNLNAGQEIESWQDEGFEITFKDAASEQRAIDSNEIWEMHWAPVLSNLVFYSAAPTLAELVAYCSEAEPHTDLDESAILIEVGDLLEELPDHLYLELVHNPHRLQDLTAKAYFNVQAVVSMVSQIKSAVWRDQMIESEDFWELSWTRKDGHSVKAAGPTLPELLSFVQQLEDWARQRRTTQMLKNISR